MANTSILAAFERMWQHIVVALGSKADASHTHSFDEMGGVTPITNGGTGATDGETAMKNLLASGDMILSSYQYGDTLPEAGIVGRIFFKKVGN